MKILGNAYWVSATFDIPKIEKYGLMNQKLVMG